MGMNEEVRNWLSSAEYDLNTAERSPGARKYICTVLFCHLAIEKILKARIQQFSGGQPPRSHNPLLLRLIRLQLPETIAEFLGELSDLGVPTRYPLDFQGLLESRNRARARECLKNAKDAL